MFYGYGEHYSENFLLTIVKKDKRQVNLGNLKYNIQSSMS